MQILLSRADNTAIHTPLTVVPVRYSHAALGGPDAVSDAGIVSNTRHGLFSTYASNSFAGYVAA